MYQSMIGPFPFRRGRHFSGSSVCCLFCLLLFSIMLFTQKEDG